MQPDHGEPLQSHISLLLLPTYPASDSTSANIGSDTIHKSFRWLGVLTSFHCGESTSILTISIIGIALLPNPSSLYSSGQRLQTTLDIPKRIYFIVIPPPTHAFCRPTHNRFWPLLHIHTTQNIPQRSPIHLHKHCHLQLPPRMVIHLLPTRTMW